MSYLAILLIILCVIILTHGCGFSPGICPSLGCILNCIAFYTNTAVWKFRLFIKFDDENTIIILLINQLNFINLCENID